MITFKSEQYCSLNLSPYQGLFEHDRGTATVVIKDSLVTEGVVGEARARAELLKGGYAEQWVSINCIHIPTLTQNQIITFKGFNWIVKEISLSFSAPKVSMTIKGLRYE